MKVNTSRLAVLILGMHRSGTSALARVVSLLGASAPMHLMPPAPSNPRGHWESELIAALNDELLASAGTSWDDWRAVSGQWNSSVVSQKFCERLKEALITEYGDEPLFFIKDPRICRLTSFWLDLLGRLDVAPKVMISVRNPVEVAYSLKRRNGILLEKSLLLWLRHVLDAELSSRQVPRQFIHYEQLMTDWRSSILPASKKLEIAWPRLSDQAAIDIDKFLDRDLRHHEVAWDESASHRIIISWVGAAYNSILRFLEDLDERRLHLSFDEIRAKFEEACSAFGPVLMFEEQRSAEARTISEGHAREIERLREENLHRFYDHEKLKSELAQQRAERDGLEAEIQRQASGREQLQVELVEKSAELAWLEIEARRQASDQERLQVDLVEKSTELARLETEAQRQALKCETLKGDLTASADTIRELTSQAVSYRVREIRFHENISRLNGLVALTMRQRGEAETLRVFLGGRKVSSRVIATVRRRLFSTTNGIVRDIMKSGLFDPSWYVASCPEVKQSGLTPIEHYLCIGWRNGQNAHPLFDGCWYRAQGLPKDVEPLSHYISVGWKEGRDPHPIFSTQWYLKSEPDLAPGTTPLTHYIKNGWLEGRDPHPLFRSAWYLEDFPELESIGLSPLEHYLRGGWREGRNPHPLFSVSWYLDNNPDIRDAGIEPLTHYLEYGAQEGRQPHALFDVPYWRNLRSNFNSDEAASLVSFASSDPTSSCHPLFDAGWYLTINPDVASAGVNAFSHYLRNGWREGRDPHPLFSVRWYLESNPDVRAADTEPLTHYVRYGDQEGRQPHPLFDPRWYRSQAKSGPFENALIHYVVEGYKKKCDPGPLFDGKLYRSQFGEFDREIEPLTHYLVYGTENRKNPNRLFDSSWYLDQNPDVLLAEANPLVHYVECGFKELRDPHPQFSTLDYLVANPEEKNSGNCPLHFVLSQGDVNFGTFSQMPKDSEAAPRARAVMIEEYGIECAERVRKYFQTVFDLERQNRRQNERAKTLALHRQRLKELSVARVDDRPVDVSIIIPAFNHIEYTIACIWSILEHPTKYKYEVIVGNNRSDDETEEVLSSIGGIVRLVTHATNEGFIRNCNLSAGFAEGQYVVLLNNDTFVLDGWLDALIEPFETMKFVGLVGSKLLMADGSLQEAGGIYWKDGSAWNFGRNQDPRLPEFNYLKDVDYISGASIAVRTAIWREVAGFDERYMPAYCDDSDLAFTLRSRGYRTIYQPFSAVIHHEGVTHGTDTGAGVKSYQTTNTKKFLEKWGEILNTEHFSNGKEVFLARDRSRQRPHILVVDHYIPQPDRDAGSKSMFHYLKLFVEAGFQVTFWPDNLHRDRDYARMLQSLGIEVIYGDIEFGEWFHEVGGYFNYVFLSRAHIAKNFMDEVRKRTNASIIFYGHDINKLRLEQELTISEKESARKELQDWGALEERMWEAADVIYYPAEFECAYVRQKVPNKLVRRIPVIFYSGEDFANGNRWQAVSAVPRLIFVGGFRHRPNVDAMLWFCHEVLPLVRAEFSDAFLQIVGSFPPPEIAALESDNIVVTGYVSEQILDLLYGASSLSVVPLRYGGGVKGKMIDAFVRGVPIVSTSVGLQGLDGAESCVELANDATSIAQSISRLLKDSDHRNLLAKRGKAFVKKHYSRESAIEALAHDISEFRNLAQRNAHFLDDVDDLV